MQDKQIEVQTSNSRKFNGFTITAIVMAATSILINPFSILSILGIVFGGVGIAKSVNTNDKTWAIISLVVSIAETLLWIATFASEMAAL
jgi:hypothetical protein